jgi:hypothetical protein
MTLTEKISIVFSSLSLILSFLALFQDNIKRFFIKPITRMSLDNISKTLIQREDLSSNCFYYRIGVENVYPKFFSVFKASTYPNVFNVFKIFTPIENSEIFLAKIEEKQPDKSYREKEDYIPMNLKWSKTSTIDDKNNMYRVSPGLTKYCDLFHIINPKDNYKWYNKVYKRVYKNADDCDCYKTILYLDTEVDPTNLCNLLKKGEYRFHIIIAADNIKPIRQTLECNFTGEWYNDVTEMFKKGVVISNKDK